MAIDNTTKTWSKKITEYCVEHCMNYADFARKSGVQSETLREIVRKRCKTISIKNLGLIKNLIERDDN